MAWSDAARAAAAEMRRRKAVGERQIKTSSGMAENVDRTIYGQALRDSRKLMPVRLYGNSVQVRNRLARESAGKVAMMAKVKQQQLNSLPKAEFKARLRVRPFRSRAGFHGRR